MPVKDVSGYDAVHEEIRRDMDLLAEHMREIEKQLVDIMLTLLEHLREHEDG